MAPLKPYTIGKERFFFYESMDPATKTLRWVWEYDGDGSYLLSIQKHGFADSKPQAIKDARKWLKTSVLTRAEAKRLYMEICARRLKEMRQAKWANTPTS